MKCPLCGHQDDRVLDTRVQKDGSIRRRRECLSCKHRYTTFETILLNLPYVIKKDGRREPFNREKIHNGLQAATQKRPISQNDLELLVDHIAHWILQKGENEIPTRTIGEKVMFELKKLDDVAYVRFASVYKTFRDVQEFVETLGEETQTDHQDQHL